MLGSVRMIICTHELCDHVTWPYTSVNIFYYLFLIGFAFLKHFVFHLKITITAYVVYINVADHMADTPHNATQHEVGSQALFQRSGVPSLPFSRSVGSYCSRFFANCGPSEPVTAVVVCITATCSYISAEVHVKLWCRVRSGAVGTALVQHRSRNQA